MVLMVHFQSGHLRLCPRVSIMLTTHPSLSITPFAVLQPDASVHVTCPALSTPSPAEWVASGQPAPDPYLGRFLGNYYVKLMSRAQVYEWVVLDGLRSEVTW